MVKQYIIVKNTQDFGFWEIDTEKHSVNLRKKNYTIPDDSKLEYYDDKYNTIVDYFTDQFNDVYVKEIIKDRKYMYSTYPFCSHCSSQAVISRITEAFCSKHSGLNFI